MIRPLVNLLVASTLAVAGSAQASTNYMACETKPIFNDATEILYVNDMNTGFQSSSVATSFLFNGFKNKVNRDACSNYDTWCLSATTSHNSVNDHYLSMAAGGEKEDLEFALIGVFNELVIDYLQISEFDSLEEIKLFEIFGYKDLIALKAIEDSLLVGYEGENIVDYISGKLQSSDLAGTAVAKLLTSKRPYYQFLSTRLKEERAYRHILTEPFDYLQSSKSSSQIAESVNRLKSNVVRSLSAKNRVIVVAYAHGAYIAEMAKQELKQKLSPAELAAIKFVTIADNDPSGLNFDLDRAVEVPNSYSDLEGYNDVIASAFVRSASATSGEVKYVDSHYLPKTFELMKHFVFQKYGLIPYQFEKLYFSDLKTKVGRLKDVVVGRVLQANSNATPISGQFNPTLVGFSGSDNTDIDYTRPLVSQEEHGGVSYDSFYNLQVSYKPDDQIDAGLIDLCAPNRTISFTVKGKRNGDELSGPDGTYPTQIKVGLDVSGRLFPIASSYYSSIPSYDVVIRTGDPQIPTIDDKRVEFGKYLMPYTVSATLTNSASNRR